MNPLYYSSHKSIEKTAGYKLPQDPSLWYSEIIRHLQSQHSYLPLGGSELDMRQIDASKGAAVGSIILENKVAIPVIIKRRQRDSVSELSPLDVFFYDGAYHFLDADTVREVLHDPVIGKMEPPRSAARGGNPYIGDMTGDSTPLEYSGQASPFSGPFDGGKMASLTSDRALLFGTTGAIGGAVQGAITSGGGVGQRLAGAGKKALVGALAGSVAGAGSVPIASVLQKKQKKQEKAKIRQLVKREVKKSDYVQRLTKEAYVRAEDVSAFRNMVLENPQILQASGNNLGIVESFARQENGLPSLSGHSQVKSRPNILQIWRDGPRSKLYIKFTGEPAVPVTESELRGVLGSDTDKVLHQVESGSVFIHHDGINMVSVDVISGKSKTDSDVKEITSDGLYEIAAPGGSKPMTALVSQAIVTLDGRILPMKLAVAVTGEYAMAKTMYGRKMGSKTRIPSSPVQQGSVGVFVNYVHGTPIVTMPMRLLSVQKIGDQVLYIAQDEVMGRRVVVSPVAGTQGFTRITNVRPEVAAVSHGTEVYYIPADSEWIRLHRQIEVATSPSQLEKVAADLDPSLSVMYDGGEFMLKMGGLVSTGFRQAAKVFKPGGVANVAKSISNIAANKGAGSAAKAWAPGAAVLGTAALGAAGAVAGGARVISGGVKQADWHTADSAPEAVEFMVSMGMINPVEALDEAMQHPGSVVKIAGLHAPQLSVWDTEWIEIDQRQDPEITAMRPGPEMLKAAAESGNPETLDALLSLEFITPQNLRYFTDRIDDFDATASRLAALLVSVRLGAPHVEESSVKDALSGLSATIAKLRILKASTEK